MHELADATKSVHYKLQVPAPVHILYKWKTESAPDLNSKGAFTEARGSLSPSLSKSLKRHGRIERDITRWSEQTFCTFPVIMSKTFSGDEYRIPKRSQPVRAASMDEYSREPTDQKIRKM
ncbi:hypothetical protein Mapa_002952 [Marchantia paleacea]|nr:hypothetical protein Mapa_002952 [Marchantia paleacea]